jgi:hypothetical protein
MSQGVGVNEEFVVIIQTPVNSPLVLQDVRSVIHIISHILPQLLETCGWQLSGDIGLLMKKEEEK